MDRFSRDTHEDGGHSGQQGPAFHSYSHRNKVGRGGHAATAGNSPHLQHNATPSAASSAGLNFRNGPPTPNNSYTTTNNSGAQQQKLNNESTSLNGSYTNYPSGAATPSSYGGGSVPYGGHHGAYTPGSLPPPPAYYPPPTANTTNLPQQAQQPPYFAPMPTMVNPTANNAGGAFINAVAPTAPGHTTPTMTGKGPAGTQPLLVVSGANTTSNASLAHAHAAASYSAVAATNNDASSKEESRSVPFRNYNNYVKKAVIQTALDTIAAKMAAVDAVVARRDQQLREDGGVAEQQQQPPQYGGAGNMMPPPAYSSNSTAAPNGSFASRNTAAAAAAAAAAALPPLPYRLHFGPNGKGITVLDLASGRGGDIGKWIFGQNPSYVKLIGQHTNDPSKFISVKRYLAADIAHGAVEAAQQRYNEAKSTPADQRLMKMRHQTPIADGHFFVGNCLVGSFFEAPSTPPPPTAAAQQPHSAATGGRSPSLGYQQAPPAGSAGGGAHAFGESPSLRPQQHGGLPPPPSYDAAVASLGGIANRTSNPNTPHHQPALLLPGTPGGLARTSPSLLPRQTGLERFGGVVAQHVGCGSLGNSTSATNVFNSSAHSGLPPPFEALPHAGPATISHLAEALTMSRTDEVNIISVQFAFHYACYAKENLAAVLKGMAQILRGGGATNANGSGSSSNSNSHHSTPGVNQLPSAGNANATTSGGSPGGLLILTTVDGHELSKRLVSAFNKQLPGSPTVTYESQLYTLTADTESIAAHAYETTTPSAAASLPLGTMYKFKLEGLVDCEEFVVPYEVLVSTANSVGLRLVESKPFNHWMGEFSTNKKVKQQLGNDGEVGEGDLDLINIYRTYVFEA